MSRKPARPHLTAKERDAVVMDLKAIALKHHMSCWTLSRFVEIAAKEAQHG